MRVTFSVGTRGYHCGDGEDSDEPYSWRGTERQDITYVHAYENPAGEPTKTEWGTRNAVTRDLDVNAGDTVYGVVATYSTGDTFGRSEGEVAVMDIFTTLDGAELLVETLSAEEEPNDRGVSSFAREHVNGQKYWLPWVGYFETLEDIAIHAVRVGRDASASARRPNVRYW